MGLQSLHQGGRGEEERDEMTIRTWPAVGGAAQNSRSLSEGGITFTLGGTSGGKLDSCFRPPPTLLLGDYLDY